MPRDSRLEILRSELLDVPETPIQAFNAAFHSSCRALVARMNREYVSARAAFAEAFADRPVLGLILVYEQRFESHTGLELGYIRWRSGIGKTNKAQAAKGKLPVTKRIPKSSRSNLHYMLSDFAGIRNWSKAGDWERRLVMETETRIRPLREALRKHEQTQRAYLYGPTIPELNFSFSLFDD